MARRQDNFLLPHYNYQTRKSREKKEREVAQVTILLAILNKSYDFEIKKPSKKSLGGLIIPNIIKILEEGKLIVDIDFFVNQRIEKILTEDKFTSRNKNRVKRVTINNFLIDMADIHKISVETKSTKKNCLEQWDRIISIQVGKEKISWDLILKIYKKLNLSLVELFENNVNGSASSSPSSITLPTNLLYKKFKEILHSDEWSE